MKFAELKKNLKTNVDNVYILCGNDRYLCYNALKLIKERLNLAFEDLNSVCFAEQSFNENAVIEAGEVIPFGDEFRLVLVKDVANIKSASEKFLRFLQNVPKTTVLVFFSPEKTDYIKSIERFATLVNCDKLDEENVKMWITSHLAKKNVSIAEDALDCLCEYTSCSLTRISNEIEKLASFVGFGGKVEKKDVDTFVEKDKDYQIYELNEAIALGKANDALDMLFVLLGDAKNEFYILSPMYSYFRRLLFIKTSFKNDAGLAKDFGIKEFAVKKMREKTKLFSAKQLKQCVDILADCDLKIKSGKMQSDVAVKLAVLQIIQMRNK